MADLFADTVEIALRFQETRVASGARHSGAVQRVLARWRPLNGRADLVLPGYPERQNAPGILGLVASAAHVAQSCGTTLRVVAALYARSDKWRDSIDCVRVRYLRTGEIVNVYGRNRPAWTQPLLVMACQAVTDGRIAVPRLAISALQCDQCLY